MQLRLSSLLPPSQLWPGPLLAFFQLLAFSFRWLLIMPLIVPPSPEPVSSFIRLLPLPSFIELSHPFSSDLRPLQLLSFA